LYLVRKVERHGDVIPEGHSDYLSGTMVVEDGYEHSWEARWQKHERGQDDDGSLDSLENRQGHEAREQKHERGQDGLEWYQVGLGY
jgi:hypothetical protein